MTMNLFSEEVTAEKTPKRRDAKQKGQPLDVVRLAAGLVHPFPRYGLAVAMASYSSAIDLHKVSEEDLREALSQAIEAGLNTFRMETDSNPQTDATIDFRSISINRLVADAGLVQKAGLSAQGKYLFPTIITSDGGAKGTFDEAMKIVAKLRSDVSLTQPQEMKRSFAPMMGEINNGGKEKTNEKGTLFEAACAAIATVASDKPAAWANMINTGIYPDLPLEQLVEFYNMFQKLQFAGTNRMQGKPSKKKEFRRPILHDGNYPDAPRDSAFGAVGLLAAIGYWANRVSNTERAQALAVLDSLDSTSLYLISYEGVHQAQFSHHVINLAKSGELRGIIDSFYRQVRPYAVFDAPFLDQTQPAVRHLFFAFNRFMQRFDLPSFRDFLATRAEYPPSIDLLLGVYFVEQAKIDRSIVESARALGQWINRTAYFVAEEDTPKETSDRIKAVRKAKAKVLVEFESAVMSSESPEDMLHRVSTRAGRLLQYDAPAEAATFFDEAAIGEKLNFVSARHLLIAYLRLRSAKIPALIVTGETTVNTGTEGIIDPADLEPAIED